MEGFFFFYIIAKKEKKKKGIRVGQESVSYPVRLRLFKMFTALAMTGSSSDFSMKGNR